MGVDNQLPNDGDPPRITARHVMVLPGHGTQVMISRPPFTQAAFDELHLRSEGEVPGVSISQKFKNNCFCTKKRLWTLITGYIPVIRYLRYYKFREYAVSDIFAGLSVGTIHLPQALAFGLLASAKVENGLLASLWPPVAYVIFGTSAHISMGTSAVICLLTASAIDREGQAWLPLHPKITAACTALCANVSSGTCINECINKDPEYLDFKEEIAMSLSLIIGVILIIMGFLKLGFITSYLSDSFFAAFTSAAAVHIGTTQLAPMLGLTVPRFPGVFKLIKTYEAIFNVLNTANFASIILALITIAIIWVVKELVNERYKQKLFAPIPIELFIVILGTVASYFGNFRTKFHIAVVGDIPLGIPMPKVPIVGLQIAPNYIADAIVMAILTFAYTIAIGKICAKKHNYQLDDSQEMISYGICNFASSFLNCIPSCVSPPRSMVSSGMNARTTLSGIFSCLLMLLVVMIVAALFKELPKAVLGAIIFIALKSLFIQIKDVYKYWLINKYDFVIWVFTFFATVFIDIDIGLYVGVGVSALTVLFQTQFARGFSLGYTKNDTMLVKHKRYRDSSEIPGVKVFRFQSNLFYANAEIFRNSLYRKSVNPRKLLKGLQKREKRQKKLNDERIAQGLPALDDNNFIVTGEMDKTANHVSYHDLTVLPQTADQDYPLTILKPMTEHGRLNGHSTPDLSSLEHETGSRQDLIVPTYKAGLNGIKRVQLTGVDNPLFTVESSNNNYFSSAVRSMDQANPGKPKNSESVVSLYSISFDDYEEDPDDGDEMFTDEKLRQMRKIHHVIVDCSPINYIDAAGANVLIHIFSEYTHVNIKLYLAGCSAAIRRTMRQAGVFDKIPESNFFVDVHDAVSYARPQRPQPIRPENIRDFSDEEAIENSRAVNS